MGMKVIFNRSALEAAITNTAEVASKNASQVLRRAAIKIRDLARAYAPLDTGTLEKAIDYGTIRDSTTRRNVFVVYIDLDATNPKDGKSLGEYAAIMEQQLHPYGRRSGKLYFTLREKSEAKGPKVGGRFLKRAIDEGSAGVVEQALLEVKRSLSGRLINMEYEGA